MSNYVTKNFWIKVAYTYAYPSSVLNTPGTVRSMCNYVLINHELAVL
jgi:hypothetical protein